MLESGVFQLGSVQRTGAVDQMVLLQDIVAHQVLNELGGRLGGRLSGGNPAVGASPGDLLAVGTDRQLRDAHGAVLGEVFTVAGDHGADGPGTFDQHTDLTVTHQRTQVAAAVLGGRFLHVGPQLLQELERFQTLGGVEQRHAVAVQDGSVGGLVQEAANELFQNFRAVDGGNADTGLTGLFLDGLGRVQQLVPGSGRCFGVKSGFLEDVLVVVQNERIHRAGDVVQSVHIAGIDQIPHALGNLLGQLVAQIGRQVYQV